MKDMNKIILVVDIVLKDGRGELKNGIVFDTEDKGVEAINDREYLEAIFNRTAPVWKIQYQNRYINTTLTFGNIESYKIKEILVSQF
jgi:hypothetical protein